MLPQQLAQVLSARPNRHMLKPYLDKAQSLDAQQSIPCPGRRTLTRFHPPRGSSLWFPLLTFWLMAAYPGNYFASDLYVRGFDRTGAARKSPGRSPAGHSLIPCCRLFIQGLDKETGQASKMVLYNCGRWWGKNFYARFCEELNDYHSQPVANLSMAEFLLSLQQCWKTHGWGQIQARYGLSRSKGFCALKSGIHPLLPSAPQGQAPSGDLERGMHWKSSLPS
jgi:hypothetical protein